MRNPAGSFNTSQIPIRLSADKYTTARRGCLRGQPSPHIANNGVTGGVGETDLSLIPSCTGSAYPI